MNEEPEPAAPLPPPETETGTDGDLVAVPEPPATVESGSLLETASDIDELAVGTPSVAIVVADHDDLTILGATETALAEREISSETRVMSADEEPHSIAAYAENARMRGIRVIVAGAGPAARLPTMVSVHTRLPVIGVPLSTQGARAEELAPLLGSSGVDEEPVAWVGLDDAVGAAVLAARVLGA